MMTQSNERDYVLGTNEEELQRLGLQHRVWRPTALNCWQRAGITVGSRVLDVGAGPVVFVEDRLASPRVKAW